MLSTVGRQRGASLIEIAVVLTIIGLLLVLSAPGIGEWLRNTQARNTATSLQAGLQRARAEAIRRNVPVQFTLVTTQTNLTDACAATATGLSWIVSRQDPSGLCSADVSETTSPQIIEKSAGGIRSGGVTVAAWSDAAGTASATGVTFNGFGRITNAGAIARIDVANGQGSDNTPLRLVIGSGGTVRMCMPSAALAAANDARAC